MRRVSFDSKGWDEYQDWDKYDRKVRKKIDGLIKDARKNPFDGIGKPEPLKHELKGYWSRRITDEHRLVYAVSDTEIVILSCRSHYEL